MYIHTCKLFASVDLFKPPLTATKKTPHTKYQRNGQNSSSLTKLELANVNKLKATYPAKPLKAFWTALHLRKHKGPEIPMAIVLDTHYCGLERRSTKADGYMGGPRVCFETGATPLLIAVQACRLDVVQLLVSAGADVNATSDETAYYLFTPLLVSVACSYTHISKYLLDEGCNVNTRNKDGDTLLHSANLSRKPEDAKLLMDYGADIMALSRDNSTPLHRAVGCPEPDFVTQLVAEGASLTKVNAKGQTPLENLMVEKDRNLSPQFLASVEQKYKLLNPNK